MPAPTAINRIPLKRALVFLAPAILFCCTPVRLQEPAPAMNNYVRSAQEFLITLYPDLTGRGYIVSLETGFRFDVPMNENSGSDLDVGRAPKDAVVGYLGGYMGKSPPKKKLQAGIMHPEQLLVSSFQFNDNGKLISFAARGPSLGNPDKYDEVIDLVLNHLEVKDEKAATILKQAGARYGPAEKGEFVQGRLSRSFPGSQTCEYTDPKATLMTNGGFSAFTVLNIGRAEHP